VGKLKNSNSRRGGLTEAAYAHVKGMLVEGQLTDQEWFPIDAIAATLGASRQPVMDALRRLAVEGFVEIVPQVGCRPRRADLQEVRDFFHFFAEGEALIAELAAQRANAEEVFSMRLISAQIGALAQQSGKVDHQGDMYRRMNRQLHAEMRKAARTPILAEIVESLGDRSDFFLASHKDEVFALNLGAAHAEHEAIIDAIDAGNAEEAREAMKHHIFATERRLETVL
jgi:DNA-binding GntR family transcriptional regulator